MATKRPDGRVEPGQRISSAFSAKAWNRAQDAADVVLGARTGAEAGASAGAERASNIVLIENNSGFDIGILGVLGVSPTPAVNLSGGTIEGTSAASSAVRQMLSRIILTGVIWEPVLGDRVAIAVEPIRNGAFGRCAVAGAMLLKVHVVDQAHYSAGPIAGNPTMLRSCRCGPIKLLWKESVNGEDKWAVGVI